MNELIKISQVRMKTDEVNAVNARDLHMFLESKTDFSNWIKRRIDEADAVENTDYTSFAKNGENQNGGRPQVEYIITLDLAKEIAMLERNQKGKEIHRYFIECEKQLTRRIKAPITMKEALLLALEQQDQIEALEAQQKANLPYVTFAKAVEAGATSINIGDYAKALCNNDKINVGQKRLFKWLRENGYLQKDNMPYQNQQRGGIAEVSKRSEQKYIDNGYFEVVTNTIVTTRGNMQTFTTKVTSKGQVALSPKIEFYFSKSA